MAKRVFKTKRKLAGGKTEYRAWKEWDEGDIFIGKLVGTSQNRKNKGKNDWIFECIEVAFADKKEEKRLRGKSVTLNTAGQLDKGMGQVEMGHIVQITYNGSKEMEGGEYEGQNAHTMEIELVEEDDGAEAEAEDILDEEESELEEEDSEEDEEEDEDEEAPPPKKNGKKGKKKPASSDEDDL